MKIFLNILSLLLCFELIVGPLNISLLTADIAHAEEKTCGPGLTFNSSVNRCLTSEEVVRINNATQSCGTDVECYKNNAKAELQKKVDEGVVKSKDNFLKDEEGNLKGYAKSLNGAVIAIPFFLLIKQLVDQARVKKTGTKLRCRPGSLLLMYAAAAILGTGEVVTWITHSNKLSDNNERWNTLVVPKKDANMDDQRAQATEAQSQAFEFLALNEDSVAETSKAKLGYYSAVTGIFATATLLAGTEIIRLIKAKATPPTLGVATNPDYIPAQNTIQQLTCGTKQGDAEKDKEYGDAADKEAAEKTAAAEKAAADKAGNKTSTDNDLTNKLNNLGSKDVKIQDVEEGPSGGSQTQEDSDPDSFKYQPNQPQNYNNPIPKRHDDTKAKIIAAKNISHARNVEELAQLMREYESIEFENYSKVSYFDEDLESYKKITLPAELSQVVASVLLSEAYASNGQNLKTKGIPEIEVSADQSTEKTKEKNFLGGVMDKAGNFTGLLGNIQKTFKFKNGQPLSIQELRAVEGKMKAWYNKVIYSPYTRLALNALMGTWMGFMSHHMKEQKKISEARAAKLREMKQQFESANGLMFCKSEDRDDPSKPKCYCFTSDNKPNPARSNSKICDTDFVGMDVKSQNNVSSIKTCVDESYNFDPKCSCKTKKTSNGSNSCLKVSSAINFKGFNPGSFRMLSAGAGPGNDLLNGNMSSGSMDSAANEANAAKIRAAAEDLVKKVAPNELSNSKKLANQMQASLLATTSGLSMGGLGSAKSLPSNPKDAIQSLEKEFKEETAPEVTKSGGGVATTPSSTAEEQPEFGLTEEQLAAQESEIAEVMGQEMDMGNNDINSGEKTNLFDVLSNRYKRSGMRRLFDEEGKTKADAPSKSDVAP